MALDALFKPFEFKSLKLPNRVVMAPMTRSFSPGGVATDEVAAYYRRRAENQVGLIVTEGTGVARPASLNDANIPRFHGEKELAAWKKVVDEVHAAGGLIAPQLWHVGSAKGKDVLGKIDSPSGLSKPGGNPFTEPMTDEEVADTIAAFASAAANAKALGFDAVELHGAHGYLIDQFFWNGTNVRGDAFGGPGIAERSKFAAEILKAVRAAVGPDYPVIIRLSQWKQQDYAVKNAETPQLLEAWLQPLADAGADIFHCSQRRFWEPEFEGSDLNFAGWAKKLTGAPTITVGSVGLSGEFIAAFGGEGSQPASIDGLLERLERDEFDLVGVGRAILQDPEWVVKIRDGREDELKSFERSALGVLY
ncbi:MULTISPECIES: NADH:flavin oxidoreductase [Caulobacter]|jgi:2,4-dienoyl-CoA reductase-like NADH-dependent reductase (Old Yellow Enzyme family)|uniref:2,4-dienoyl-CoA reductase-like NADH-dependent reductase (Old Yellow Enzyme family) n=1 Tax=Caulobacter rhizosphaerae TaxID=2010972 RepID=A0ABU1MZI4_9CAUL|nr:MULTISPECIES: NADH:flavin oxidoreductase [Caulobacter]KQZ18294.1 1,2-oxophytodienoate reductase [Caulobacter sp. Root1472]MDR6531603.1 2,4-dienoyl-CoA reductase-like NADH-dependent reductase (Old Yellow Enzyme family) [Caulobacter rhizosphaerae]